MKHWRAVARSINYVRWYWIGNMGGITVIFLAYQVPGLVNREFFNLITGDAPTGFNLWSLVALLFAGGLGRLAGMIFTVSTNVPLGYRIAALLQKNMLGRIFKLPGASALEGAAGEAISRFRGDVDETRRFPLRINDWIASIVNGVVSIAIMAWMAWIDPYITMICLIPILTVTGFVYVLRMRIAALRKAAREAAGNVTGFIGELFGAVQAVKVATAERSMIEHFGTLNQQRSRTALRDRLFDQLMESVFRKCRQHLDGGDHDPGGAEDALGRLHSGRFLTVRLLPSRPGGDDLEVRFYFRPFQAAGRLLRPHAQADAWRPRRGSGGSWADLHERRRTAGAVRDLAFHHPDSGRGVEGVDAGTWFFHRHHRPYRFRQDHPPASSARPAAEGRRGDPLERKVRRGPGVVFRAATIGLHAAGALALQRAAA